MDYIENAFGDMYALDAGIHAERSPDGQVVFLKENDAKSVWDVVYGTLQAQVATTSVSSWGENFEWLSVWLGILLPAVALCIVVLAIQTGEHPEKSLPDADWIYAAVGVFATFRVLGAVLKYLAAANDSNVRHWLVEIYSTFVTSLLDHLKERDRVHNFVPRVDMIDLNAFRVFEFLLGLVLVIPASYTVANNEAGWGFALWFVSAVLTHDAIVATADNKRRFIQVFYLYIADTMEHFRKVYPDLEQTAGFQRAQLEIAQVRSHIPEVYRARRSRTFGAQETHLHTFAVDELRKRVQAKQ